MMRARAVIERDIRKFMRNPVIMVMAVVMPLAYLVILGNSFQGKLKGLPLAVVNMDAGEHGRRVTEAINAVSVGPKTVRLVWLTDQGDAVEGVKDGRFKGALIVPPDFSRRIEAKTGPEVGLFVDNTDQISSGTLNDAVAQAVSSVNVPFVAIRPDRSQVNTRRVELYRLVDYDQTLVPGVVVMAMFMGTMITGVFNLVMGRLPGRR